MPISTAAGARQTSTRAASGVSLGKQNLLRQGAAGADVKQLQRALNAGGVKTAINGKFDAQTTAAVREYQRAKGLQVDGVVGRQTWGRFVGKSYPPETHTLAGGTRPQSQGNTAGRSGPTDSFERGPAKQVTAYVNGQQRVLSVVPVGNGQYLRPDAAKAFVSMKAAASRAGFNLGARSGFRTMAQQQALYRSFLRGRGNLAARPGFSNHQNGIAMDISGVGGRGTAASHWLRANAGRFAFRNLPSEFWHYDFVA